MRLISLDEVSKHNLEDPEKTCWIVISGKVYDVTPFLDEHPGGPDAITQLAGQDATGDFFDIGHSSDALQMADEYLVGELVGEESNTPALLEPASNTPALLEPASNTPALLEPASKATNQAKEIISKKAWNSPDVSTLTNFAVPAAIGVLIFAIFKVFIK